MKSANVFRAVGLVALLVLPAAAEITTESMLEQMTDLQRLTRFPEPAYTTRQFSSYDRKAKSPSEDWFANADAGQFLRSEDNGGRKEYVMMDIDGPGAIVRIWSANPEGTIRIYLDADEKPEIEVPMKDLLGGTFAGLPKPIAGERSRGWNLYFPIPYAKHCKVTSDKDRFYYHVNYRTYASGTKVKTFDLGELKSLATKIEAAARALEHPHGAGAIADGTAKVEFDFELAPGAERTIAELKGAKEIAGFRVQIVAENVPAAARGTLLSMWFDGEHAVESPLGDFFGTAPGMNVYESLPLGVTQGADAHFWSHWRMPFEKSAKLVVKNLGDAPVKLKGLLNVQDYKWDDRSMVFHAKWRIERDLPTRPFIDWTHLEVKGKGVFVGGALYFVNPVKSWWGEGDEKIYVDGETFPSHFGTGTEDYYGYAWGSPVLFVHAYHNQPRCDGPGTYGDTSLNRFHILDDIPFTNTFKFDMENWHWAETVKVVRAAISYWYAPSGGKDMFQPLTAEDVRFVPVTPYQVHRVAGVLEGEDLAVLEKRAGETLKQPLSEKFSGEAHLRWNAAAPGDRLTVGFDVPAAAHKHVIVHLTKAGDFGKVQLSVNGQKAGAVIDLYSKQLAPSGEIDLGAFDLAPGQNKITVEVIGANEDAKGKYAFGLDYVRLTE